MIAKVATFRNRIAYLSSGHAVGADTRIRNAPGGHGCLVRVNDELEFESSADFLKSANFVHIPDVELQQQELSEVTATTDNGMIFGKRINPDCRCGIFIGVRSHHPNLKLGDVVSHNLGIDDHGRPRAENVKLENKEVNRK